MSMIETVTDVNNSFLSRREITCNFRGLGGKLKRSEAVDMVTKECNSIIMAKNTLKIYEKILDKTSETVKT